MPKNRLAPVMGIKNRTRTSVAVFMTAAFGFFGVAVASIGADTPGRLMEDLARDYGLESHQAAGIVGNFQVETGNFKHQQELNPTVAGSRGGYGIAQWTGPRRRALESYASSNGLDVSSYEAQYGFLTHELNGDYAYVMRQMQTAGSVEEATRIFMEQFERPGVPHWDKRLEYAMNAANGQYGNPGGGAGGSGMGGSSAPIEQMKLKLMPWGAG